MSVVKRGQTFKGRLHKNDPEHLWIVLTSPCDLKYRNKKTEWVLVINIQSGPVSPEHTLDVGDHSFIQHKSYVQYGKAEVVRMSYLIDKIGRSQEYEDLRADILNDICSRISKRTVKRHILNFYKAATQNL